MSLDLLSYSEVLEQTDGQQKTLLLGNGFSMSYNKERFSFTSLLDSAVEKGLIDDSSPIYYIFKKFGTTDFEEVIKLLETSIKILKEYSGITPDCEEVILNDSKALKKHLVEIITNNHPEKITDITDDEFLNSTNFIKGYDLVFTLNYDLLLYWTTIKLKIYQDNKVIEKGSLKITDGFDDLHSGDKDYVTYANDSKYKQKVNYLHGALHIFDNKYEIIKNTYSRTQKTLKEQTLENLTSNIYPVFVSEGTSVQKKSKIIHNAYLNHCYKSFSKIGSKNSSMIVFGTLLKRNDLHIREAILNNGVKRIYFGVASEDEKLQLEVFSDELKEKNKEVHFYDYRTATVWR